MSSWKENSPQSFVPLHELLTTGLKKIAKGKWDHTLRLEKNWKDIAGDMLSKNSRVLFVKENILHIGVRHSSWLYELGLIKNNILKKIREKMPEIDIKDIRLKMTPL